MVLTVLLDPYGKKEYDETVVEHRSVHLNFLLLTDVEKYLQKHIFKWKKSVFEIRSYFQV